jgi:hypothetical protein
MDCQEYNFELSEYKYKTIFKIEFPFVLNLGSVIE